MITWHKYDKDNLPPEGAEVIAFNSDWIDEDFNPKGQRVGFRCEDRFITSKWVDYHEDYMAVIAYPEWWTEMPLFEDACEG